MRHFEWRVFSAATLGTAKARLGARISVCIPARDEEETIAGVVGVIRRDLMDRAPLVDELVVVDDGSTDSTGEEAAAAGATVVRLPAPEGKGSAMRRGLAATSGDIVAYCDGDIQGFSAGFVLGLVGPLLTDPGVILVKGAYRRPLDRLDGEGGRVTELVARPLLRLLFPPLGEFRQPLAGETASRRPALEATAYEEGYGVELGMLIDMAARYGPEAMAECDLGERRHRNRPLGELVPQAETVIRVALGRAKLLPPH